MSESTEKKDNKQERTWAMLCHLLAFAFFVFPPMGMFLGPLVVWLIKKEEFPMVDDQGKESLNFQISVAIYAIVAGVLIFAIIGFFLLGALVVFWIIMVILASVKASEGERYRYPLAIRFIK